MSFIFSFFVLFVLFFVQREKIGDEDHRDIGQHGGSNWWMPIKWSISIVRKAGNEDRVANPPSYANLVKAIVAFRQGLTDVVTYGHVTVPLVYTQVSRKIVTSLKCFEASFLAGCPSGSLLLLWYFSSGATMGADSQESEQRRHRYFGQQLVRSRGRPRGA